VRGRDAMERILLTNQPADLGNVGHGFAVVAAGYEPPIGIRVVTLNDLMANTARWLDKPITMVVVGLSRMMTPTNRVQLGRVFLRPRDGLHRIMVDRQLFVSEPWRMWWQFRAVGADGPWGYTDSFLAETRWNRAIEMQEPDPFGIEPMLRNMRGVVRVVDAFRFGPIDVDVRRTDDRMKRRYAELKEEVFTHEKTLPAILRRLSQFAQEAEPDRSVPTAARLFAKPPTKIVRTDLAVDEFLVGQLLARVALTNAIAEFQ
jgi:hypothetical protein